MADNKKLMHAKEAQFNEFYTEYKTISDELTHYRDHLKGKVIYLNCDDPCSSNFWRYFHNNFASLGLKKLISTHFVEDSEPSYKLEYTGGDDFNMDAGKISQIVGDDQYTAGDFRSKACIKLLKQADIICTNPPFSLFREYLEQLIEHNKKFIIIGNQNAAHTKGIFPLFKENKVWYGASIHSGGIDFRLPEEMDFYSDNVFVRDGKHYINLAGIRWYTNLDISYRHDGLWHKNGVFDKTMAHCYYEGNEDKYPRYVNFDGINVPSAKETPIDYDGYMGVPITILDKFNPDEIEIIGSSGERKYAKRIEECVPDGSQYTKGGPAFYLKESDFKYKRVFPRIIIRNKNPIKKKDDLGI